MTPHANLLKDCVFKEAYTSKENHHNKEISTARKKGIFSFFSLRFPVPLFAYVAFCLRKRGSMAFCEKSCIGTDTTSSFPSVCVKNVLCIGEQGILREKLRVKNHY